MQTITDMSVSYKHFLANEFQRRKCSLQRFFSIVLNLPELTLLFMHISNKGIFLFISKQTININTKQVLGLACVAENDMFVGKSTKSIVYADIKQSKCLFGNLCLTSEQKYD